MIKYITYTQYKNNGRTYMNTMKQNYLSPQICSSHIWPWGGGRETTDGEKNNLSAIQALGDDQNIFKKYYSELKFTQNVVNKPCIFHWKFQPKFCENNECQRMFEGSVWPIGEWTCNNLIRELLCLSFLSSSHLLSSPATCYLQIRTRWVSQFGSPLKRVMGAVLGKNRADFFLLKLWAQNKVCRTNNGRNTEEMAHQIENI